MPCGYLTLIPWQGNVKKCQDLLMMVLPAENDGVSGVIAQAIG